MRRCRPSARRASSLAEQMARKAELDEIRLSRPLTAEEQAEDDRLTHRAYMRQWRAGMADNGIRYDRRIRHG